MWYRQKSRGKCLGISLLLLAAVLAVVLQSPATHAFLLPTIAHKPLYSQKLSIITRTLSPSTTRHNLELMEDYLLDKTMTFQAFEQMPTWLQDTCTRVGFIHPTEAQRAAIPVSISYKLSYYCN